MLRSLSRGSRSQQRGKLPKWVVDRKVVQQAPAASVAREGMREGEHSLVARAQGSGECVQVEVDAWK